MKHLKTKLMAAVAMLLVATVMLTSASFAWFTISTAPEVKDITTQVVTNENLEIALATTYKDTTNGVPVASTDATTGDIPGAAAQGDSYAKDNVNAAYTWGNLIDLDVASSTDVADSYYSDFDKTVRPATLGISSDTRKANGSALTQGTFYYPLYGTDGRVTDLSGLVDSKMEKGFGHITDNNTDVAKREIYGYYIDFWLRSNMSGTVTLSAAADRATSGTEGEETWQGAGSTFTANGQTAADQTLAENIRVAFKVLADENGGTIATNKVATAATVKAVADNAYSKTYEGNVATLTANKAVLVRMYVYLEGENVTNAAASFGKTTIGGKFNIQFTMSDVDKAMNVAGTAYADATK